MDTKTDLKHKEWKKKPGREIPQSLRKRYNIYRETGAAPDGILPKKRKFQIPAGLTRQMIDNIGLEPKHVSNVLVLLSFIRGITDYKSKASWNGKNCFAQIHGNVLRLFILTLGCDTAEFLDILEKAGWIEIIRRYKVGVRSRKYRIGPKFRTKKWVEADFKDTLETFLPEILENGYISRNRDTLYDLWNRSEFFFLSHESDLETEDDE